MAGLGDLLPHGDGLEGRRTLGRGTESELILASASLLVGVLYGVGWARLRRRGWSEAGRRGGLFAIGLAGLFSAFSLGPLAERSFAVHMVQHLFLIYLAPPFLLAGSPLPCLLWALPRPQRRSVGALWTEGRPLRRALEGSARPLPAFLLSTGLLWAWHHPALYSWALEAEPLHALEHLCFFSGFLLYWWPLVGSSPRPASLQGDGARVLYLAAGAVSSALLGAVIAFAERVLYPPYLGVSHPWGLSPLADQRLGGFVMWFPGPVIFGLAGVLLLQGREGR